MIKMSNIVITYWVWKNTIIDFNTFTDKKKIDYVFSYLGAPDKQIHEWYNGGWSSEYNTALKYARELDLIEDYRDYDDEIWELKDIIKDLCHIINKNCGTLDTTNQEFESLKKAENLYVEE